MKRQSYAAIAVVLALAIGVAMLARRGGGGRSGEQASPLGESSSRVFVSDSLGLRLRLPESPGWTLRPEPSGAPDGRIVTAVANGEKAIVRVFALPATPETTLDDVFTARQKQFATFFGVNDLETVLSKVLRDTTQEMNGRTYRQWQAVSRPTAVVGSDSPDSTQHEIPIRVAFMWLQTVDPKRSVECIGLVRLPAEPTPESAAASDSLLGDVATILQGFEVR